MILVTSIRQPARMIALFNCCPCQLVEADGGRGLGGENESQTEKLIFIVYNVLDFINVV